MALNLVMLGPPGAGKGTQAQRVAVARGIPQISTGGILRQAVQAGTELGRAAQAVMNAGLLVSDEIMVGIVRERLNQPDAAAGFILDGFPRTVAQAQALDGLMTGRDPLRIVNIDAPAEVLVARLLSRRVCERCGANAESGADPAAPCGKCGGRFVNRSDDNEATVRARLAEYQRKTQPLIDYYAPRATFRVVDGNQSPEAVAAAIARALEGAPAPAAAPGDVR
jgi:adenylate kinase